MAADALARSIDMTWLRLFFAQATQRLGLAVSQAMDSFLEEEPFDYGFFWQSEEPTTHDDVASHGHNASSSTSDVSTKEASHPTFYSLSMLVEHRPMHTPAG